MIVDKKMLAKLKDFGLNSYESKVWAALLSRGISTAGELSDIANVPRSRSYDVLESLEKKGFVVMKLGKPIKYIAVPPTEAVERVKKRIQKDAEEEEKMLDELKNSDVLEELTLLHNNGIETQDPSEITGCVKGRSNILNHIEFQLKNAKESFFITTTESGFIRKSTSLLRQAKKAKDRGVEITFAVPLSENSKDAKTAIEKYASVNEIKKSSSRFCIVDNKHVTLMLNDDKELHQNYDTAIWVISPYLANTLKSSVN